MLDDFGFFQVRPGLHVEHVTKYTAGSLSTPRRFDPSKRRGVLKLPTVYFVLCNVLNTNTRTKLEEPKIIQNGSTL